MKKIIYIIVGAFLLTFSSCELDNYDAPKSVLAGRIHYNGKSIGVKQQEMFELWQDGFGMSGAINVTITPKGEFQALLFDGDYKMVMKNVNYPWVKQNDTIYFTLAGSNKIEALRTSDALSDDVGFSEGKLNIQVHPFFLIETGSIKNEENNVTATFKVKEITAGGTLQKAHLFIAGVQNVDQTSMFISANKTLTNQNVGQEVKINVPVADIQKPSLGYTKPYVFARLAIQVKEASGDDGYIYSDVFKVNL